ncbi:NAD(P)H-quinone oxidoreductase [Ottowia thiooxydans]|uniref:NAD(P)H-quinone oxidoreductase n=1 Tax=Ottowia thiooxydans TaxID=219182 RepID=UPI001B7FDDF1|nr:NAD(P)H-quinone oxidoreductase [Ottowia thiooxydans]
MRRICHADGGPPTVMQLKNGSIPTVRSDEVLIRVQYAGVNRPDVLQRSGSYPPPPGAAPGLGLEVSGVIAAVGGEVSQWAVGDAVCALTNGGGYAQYVAAPAGQVMPVPEGMSMVEAAALPENYITVWSNVVERGGLERGETFLVHGGSSGIGLTAIQLAKARGARVYTTVGNAEKARSCELAGAEKAINYREQDFAKAVAELTDGRGVDLILDMVGGDYIARNIASLALDGRLVQIAFLQGSKVDVDWLSLMTRRLTYTGSTLRPRSQQDKARTVQALQHSVWPLLAQGQARPVIHKVFALADASAAHELMESSTHIGKIMLEVPQD